MGGEGGPVAVRHVRYFKILCSSALVGRAWLDRDDESRPNLICMYLWEVKQPTLSCVMGQDQTEEVVI